LKNHNIKRLKEFGDFQTPLHFAQYIVSFLKDLGIKPSTIIEPTCGTGSFIQASLETFPDASIIGMDINQDYIDLIHKSLLTPIDKKRITIKQADFFLLDWRTEIKNCKKPILIVGNPPWITSAEMTILNGDNLPKKSNLFRYSGLDAKTGKSNFDISEWVIITLLESLSGISGTLAMICKTSVARKVLMYCEKKKIMIEESTIHLIDSKRYFNVSVDACFFICNLKPNSNSYTCKIYKELNYDHPTQEIGIINGNLVANIHLYKKWNHLQGQNRQNWRSGIKHDCSKIMELTKNGDLLINGLNEEIRIEDEYLYPMLKSSDLANNRLDKIRKWMIVTQKYIGEDTSRIKRRAPLTWKYLLSHSQRLDARASSIYKNRPRFSIFGVGDYSFSPWKIAISGLYKQIDFRLLHPYNNKSIVLDDTCYFIPLDSLEEARIVNTLLNHTIAREFYNSFIHWDAKRPITKQILQYLDLQKLRAELGSEIITELVQKNYHDFSDEKITEFLKKEDQL
jgi:hypothetical protein